MSKPDFDVAAAHRWFAVEANNLAWSLVELSTRTVDEVERMLDAAHAARHHWAAVGTALHRVRADILLATAHALAQSDHAVRYAESALRIAATEPITHFDRASLHGSVAAAMAVAGDTEAAEDHRELYRELWAKLDDEDRPILESIYGC